MTSYWLSNYCALFSSFNIIPFTGDNKNYQYNSLTRLIILMTLLGYLYTLDINVIYSGIISLLISIVFYFVTFNSSSVEKSAENPFVENKTPAYKLTESDDLQNQLNQVSLDYTPPDTDDKRKHIYFLEGDQSSSKINNVDIDPSEFLSSGPKVVNAITKNLTTLNRNI
jgi:hypothetical protein